MVTPHPEARLPIRGMCPAQRGRSGRHRSGPVQRPVRRLARQPLRGRQGLHRALTPHHRPVRSMSRTVYLLHSARAASTTRAPPGLDRHPRAAPGPAPGRSCAPPDRGPHRGGHRLRAAVMLCALSSTTTGTGQGSATRGGARCSTCLSSVTANVASNSVRVFSKALQPRPPRGPSTRNPVRRTQAMAQIRRRVGSWTPIAAVG